MEFYPGCQMAPSLAIHCLCLMPVPYFGYTVELTEFSSAQSKESFKSLTNNVNAGKCSNMNNIGQTLFTQSVFLHNTGAEVVVAHQKAEEEAVCTSMRCYLSETGTNTSNWREVLSTIIFLRSLLRLVLCHRLAVKLPGKTNSDIRTGKAQPDTCKYC